MSEAEEKARARVLAFGRTIGLNSSADIRKALEAMGCTKKFGPSDEANVLLLLKQWKEQDLKKQEENVLTGRRDELSRMVQRGQHYRPYKERDWNKLKPKLVRYATKEERDASEKAN